jgi:hypothetical protein
MSAGAARERILGRLHDALNGDRAGDWRAGLERRLAQVPQLIRPKLPDDLLACFMEKLTLSGGTFEQLDIGDGVAAAIAGFLRRQGLPMRIRVAPALQGIGWGDRLEVSYGTTRGDDPVSVTPAFCAVAETGSVVLLSSAASPTLLNFLPDVHIVVVETTQLVSHYEDVWVKLRALAAIPRSVNFITGPSKTADIEQTLQIGAHGPRCLHVVLMGKSSVSGDAGT